MKDNSKLLMGFLLGAAAGAALGFYLATDDKDKLLSDLRNAAGKVRDDLESEIEKGKQMVDELKHKVSDLLKEA